MNEGARHGDARPSVLAGLDGAPPSDTVPTGLIFCLALAAVVIVLGIPVIAMKGGYDWNDGLFFKHQAHAVARAGGDLSGTLFALGLSGVLAGQARPGRGWHCGWALPRGCGCWWSTAA
ncbi:hypothetical protein [Frateuria sp. Soil773]|uniref:hypothetical protein n=1 Tax=Frateuria sp. Soil773 TaxID=1736407 RepID=UPI0012FBC5A1|nr:hypothetical protein [Frateuria sp. Soil773]